MRNSENHIPKEDLQIMLDETSSLASELREKWEKDEARQKRIPEKLYHVTKRSNADQILQEGIDPSRLIFENKEVVSLSDDIQFALSVASQTQNVPEANLTVLEIDTAYLTPSRIDNYLREEDPTESNPTEAAAIHEVHYQSTIPPEAIKIVK